MRTIDKMQSDFNKLNFDMMLIRIEENHITLGLYGTSSTISIFKETFPGGEVIGSDFLVRLCSQIGVYVFAENLSFLGKETVDEVNKYAKELGVLANPNWMMVAGYLRNPEDNILGFEENELDDFWKYTEKILYEELIPKFQGS